MNYYGSIVATAIEPNVIYQVLKKAMLKIDKQHPYRGPPKLLVDEFIYENSQSGSMDKFQGKEYIRKADMTLYSLNYHGGSMA